MENINYYKELKANFTTFKNTLQLNARQQKSLNSLLAYTSGALNTYRNEVAAANEKFSIYAEQIRDQKRTEALTIAKTKLQKTLDAEFKHIENRLRDAQNALQKAINPAEPKDSSETLLRFMQQREIREGLQAMPLAKRVEVLLAGAQQGDPTILRAAESQPATSDLIPQDVLSRASKVYAEKVAPVQLEALAMAKEDMQGAELVRNLAQVEMAHIEQRYLP